MVRALHEAARRGVPRTGRPRQRAVHLTLDSLEPRTLLSNVSWSGQGDGTTWTDASNWSDDAVPGPSDNVTISKTGNPTIAIASGTQSVNSISSTDPISISGGSLSVAANSTLSGGLTMTGGSLTAGGSGVSLTVTGTTTVAGAILEAEAGATFSLPQLTTATMPPGSGYGIFEAIGTGSTLNLPALTGLGQLTSYLYLEANQGGQLLLPALESVAAPSQDIQILADGASSKIDLSDLTTLAPGFSGVFSVTDQATVLDPKLTSLTSDTVTLDGTGTMAVSQWTTLTNTSIDVTGGTTTLSGVTEVSVASGEQAVLQATASGATLSLPNLTSLGSLQGTLYLEPSNGGRLLLSALSSVTSTNQYLQIVAAGAGTEIDLSALTTLAPGSPGYLSITDQATVLDPKLTSLTNETVTLDGSGTMAVSQWTTLTDTSIDVTGGTTTLSGVTSVSIPSGGQPLILQATGSGATLSLPALTSLGSWQNLLYLKASNGGQLLLPALSSVTSTNQDLQIVAAGAGSEIDLSALATLASPDVSVSATNQAAVNLPELTTVTGTLNLTAGTLTLPGLTSADGVTIDVSGGSTLILPAPSAFTATGSSVSVTGAGSSIQIGSGILDPLPASGTGVTFNVPQFPQGMTLYLNPSGTFSGGTTFNVGADATVDIQSGTYTGGFTFNVGQGAVVDLTDLNMNNFGSYGGTLTGSGSGTVQFSGGEIFPAIGSGDGPTGAGLTLNFSGTMFQWTGGVFFASLGNVTNLGTINLAGSNDKALTDGTLYNEGTIIQTGSGNLDLQTKQVSFTTLENDAGASYLIESDSGIDSLDDLLAVVNAGTIRKTAGSGTSTLTIDGLLTNTGTIEADSGTLDLEPASFAQLSSGGLTGGTWNVLDGATLEFPDGTSITSNAATIALGGAGATIAGLDSLTSNSGGLGLTGGAALSTDGAFSNSGSLTLGAGSALDVGGGFAQTSAGSLALQIGGTPSSGEYGQVAVTGSAALGGDLNVAFVNGFTPTFGDDYPVLAFASATGSFATVAGLSSGMTATQTATALDLDSAAVGADLAITSVNTPSTAAVGQSIAVSWDVKDVATTAAAGNWQDSVYLSPTATITGSSILLGTVVHTGGLGAGATYTGSLTAPVPALAPGSYYVIVEADSLYQIADPDRANNTLAASGQLAVSLPSLTLGKAVTGSFTEADQENDYQVTVPAGGSLVVSAASAAASGSLAVYVSQGTVPTPYNYQDSSAVPNQPGQTAVVPQVLTAGTYNILVESISGAAATAGYTLTVTQGSAPTISSLSTTSGGNAGNVTVAIDGTNLAPLDTATLTLGSKSIAASSIDFVSASQIFATFDLDGASVGNYTLSVEQGSQALRATTSFHVIAAAVGTLSISVNAPQFVRPGQTGTIVISYINTSSNDIVAPLLSIASTNANVLLSTPDDPNYFSPLAAVLAVAPSGPGGILRPGQSGQLSLTILSNDPIDNDTIPIQVDQIEAGQPIDWSSQKSSLQPNDVSTTAWNAIWSNLMAIVGTTTDSYNAALAQAATYLGNLGETTAQVGDVNNLWAFLAAQADAVFPAPSLSSAIDASLPTPGSLPLAVDRTFMATLNGRDQTGMFGLGWVSGWQTSLSTDDSGNVTITSGASAGYFVEQANGDYLDTDGAYGSLTQSGGVYTFTATSGAQYVFLPNDQLDYEQDTNGNRITLGYNSQNQLISLTYSNPSDPSEPTEQLTLTYNAQGFASQVANGTGDTWSYSYDSAGHLISVTAPGNFTTSYTYGTDSNPETANALLSITNPDGSQQDFTYDAQGRLSVVSQNGGADPITYTYGDGAEVTAADAAGDQTTIWFDSLGLPAREEGPSGGLSTFSYDNNGNLVSYSNAAGDIYQYSYDSNRNLTETVNPLGQTVQMTYGALSNLTSITDADNSTTQYKADAAGNLLSITFPDGTQQSFSYDPLGNMTETIEQDGDPVNYLYNAQGLVTEESFSDGTGESFTYDAQGNMLTAETFDATGTLTGTTTVTYNTDAQGQDIGSELASITYPNLLNLKFSYNAAGQRAQSVDQDGFTVNYTYNVLGQLSELTDGSGNLIVRYSYNNLNELVNKLNGNGTSTTYAYDADGDLTSEVNYAPGGKTVNSSFIYTYNVLDEVTSMTDAAGGKTSYGYDATGQLIQVDLPGGATITYVYNAAGDLTAVDDSGATTSYSSNDDNEITQAGSATYTYDANGNLASVTDSGGTTTYGFNDLNQLKSITSPDGTVTSFQYSPLGFLVGENVGGTQTSDLVDPAGGGNVVASYNGSGSLIADYTYGLGLVNQTGPSGTGYYDFDVSGNTVGLTGSSGSYVNQYSYLPFGETTTVSAALPNPFTFAGQFGVMQIGTNLFSMRARVYTPATQQFLSNDPLGIAGGTNIREYAANDPIAFSDPLGLSKSDCKNVTIFLWGWGIGDAGMHATIDVDGNYLSKYPGSPANYPKSFGEDVSSRQHMWPATTFSFSVPDNVAAGMTSEINSLKNSAFNYFTNNCAEGVTSVLQAGGYDIPSYVWSPGSLYYYLSNYTLQLPDCTPPKPPRLPSTPMGTIPIPNHAPHDPNALIGPLGYGTQGFLQPIGPWPYTVAFENDGSVAAQDVTVTEQLSANLDWSTFQLGSFAFGSIHVNVPPGLTDYQTTVSYQNVDGTPLNVLVALNFNAQTGLLTVTFTSLDPLTGQAPTGVFDGFLPPDDNNGIGEGYVQYTIDPRSGLATGTAINQQASVVFDTNAPINTAVVVNTIDVTTPSSSVAPLPATSGTTFTVSWSGSDGAGPGIAGYNVYVSDDGGPYTIWQSATTTTSAAFTGNPGHTYTFYSVATDPLGLVQPAPAAAQATTTVNNPPPPPPTITGEQALFTRKLNKKHKPVGKQVLTGFSIDFSAAMNPATAGNAANYQVDWVSIKRVKRKKAQVLHPVPIRVVYDAVDHSVSLLLSGKQAFALGGRITVISTPPGGVSSAAGVLLDGNDEGQPGDDGTFTILPLGRAVEHAK